MKNVWRLFLLLEILLFSGCVDEQGRSGAYGGISLHLSTNSTVTDVTTRSGEEEKLPSVQDFSISVLQGDKVQASWDKLADYDEDTTYPVGNYTLKASYGDIEKEGFESPYYEGAVDFEILGGKTTPVEATCRLANTKMSIDYTDDFKEYFKTYSSAIKAEQGNEVTFTSDETRSAYVKPGRVSVKVTFTKVSGGFGSTTVEVATVDALPQHHYHLLMDVDAGKAMLSIVFDRVTEEKPITLDISDKALNIKPPYFTLTGFEKTSDDNNQWDGNLIESPKLSALLTSLGGFNSCILKTKSPNLPDWPTDGFDLANLSPDDLSILNKSGVKLTGFGTNQDQMGIIDLTNVAAKLHITDENSTHLFTLQATSKYGKLSDTYVLNLTTPKDFMLLPATPVKMGGKEATLPVKLKKGNPAGVKLYYKAYGTWQPITKLSYQEIAGNPGYYNFKAGVDMGFLAKEFIAEYNSVWSSAVTVEVLVPSYNVVFDDVDVWATKAVMTIVPEDAEDLANIMSSIEPYVSLNGSNWTKWEKIKIDKVAGEVALQGLTPSATYYFKTTCDDGGSFTSPVRCIMEATMQIPNQNFANWGEAVTYKQIQNGGRSTYYSWGSKYNNPVYKDISYIEPVGWTTTNSLTTPADANPKNTWYMVPSVLRISETEHNDICCLRSVAWNDAGDKVKDNTPSGLWDSNKNAVQPPSNFKRTSGKLYLGSLLGDRDMGIECLVRPIKLSFKYKYVPDLSGDNTGGIVRLILETSGGQVIAQFTETLSSTTWVTFVKELNYQTVLKAGRLRILFTSSTNWSFVQSVENSKIKTTNVTDNSDNALKISVGSELHIENIELIYN